MAPKRRQQDAVEAKPSGGKRTKATSLTAKPPQAQPQTSKSFFLMKSEADVFSVDDLASRPQQTEPWDGVRNHQAKKVLQSMLCGDQAFFWSSNTKFPGVVGVVEVTREAYPDPLQFDAKNKYYDAKSSQEDPRWFCVDVKLVRKLPEPITLVELKEHKDGALSQMALFRMGRLSVQPVSADEWEYVLGLEKK